MKLLHKSRSEQKIKPFKKKKLIRAWCVVNDSGIQFPVVSSQWEAKQLKRDMPGKVVRVQIREEGRK